MTDRIYKERFFPHELLADANGAPATDEQSETIRGMLLDAIAERAGCRRSAQDLAAASQRAAHREAVTSRPRHGGDPIQRAGCTCDDEPSLAADARHASRTARRKRGPA